MKGSSRWQSLFLGAANTRDIKLLEETLDHIKLLVRYEKNAANYMALLQFACAVIVWRKFIRVHR